jgi:hypothetical protein
MNLNTPGTQQVRDLVGLRASLDTGELEVPVDKTVVMLQSLSEHCTQGHQVPNG